MNAEMLSELRGAFASYARRSASVVPPIGTARGVRRRPTSFSCRRKAATWSPVENGRSASDVRPRAMPAHSAATATRATSGSER